jgi:hypothetical protein
MFGQKWRRLALVTLPSLVITLGACGSAAKSTGRQLPTPPESANRPASPSPPPSTAPTQTVIEPLDPVVALIDSADRHFKVGQTELEQGHLEAAQLEFNRAVNTLVESPYGARTEPRIREQNTPSRKGEDIYDSEVVGRRVKKSRCSTTQFARTKTQK